MAKDAHGHGSDARGGAGLLDMNKVQAHVQAIRGAHNAGIEAATNHQRPVGGDLSKVHSFIAGAQDIINKNHATNFPNSPQVSRGTLELRNPDAPRWLAVDRVGDNGSPTSRSIHAVIDRNTGDVMKPNGKGHGSDPRGAHSQGVDQIGKPHISQRAMKIIAKYAERGFSVRPDGFVPKDGFQVAMKGRTEKDPIDLNNVEQSVRDHVAKNTDVYASPDTFIGGWNSPKTGKVHLEPSRNIQDPEVAFKLGQGRNQVSIWDVKRGKDIPTGGTGD